MRSFVLAVLIAAPCAFLPRAAAQDAPAEDIPAEEIPAEEIKDRFPKKVRLGKTKINALPLYSYVLPKDVEASETPGAAKATVAGEKLVFVDVDGNGRFGDVGVDAWLLNAKGFDYMFPVEESIGLAAKRVWLWFSADGKELRYRADDPELPDLKTDERLGQAAVGIIPGMVGWNRLRMFNGLPPVWFEKKLTRAAMLHAIYQSHHGIGHSEDPEKPWYTPEGAESARYSSVGTRPPAAEIIGVYKTFYHRVQLFNPDTRDAGIGAAPNSTVIDGTNGRKERAWNWPVMIPANGTTGVGRKFAEERPIAHESFWHGNGGPETGGFPITLTFPTDKVTEVSAELRKNGPDGPEVPFLLSSPEDPAHERFPSNHKSICLIAHEHLATKTTYWVKVSYTYKREKTERIWKFRTARF